MLILSSITPNQVYSLTKLYCTITFLTPLTRLASLHWPDFSKERWLFSQQNTHKEGKVHLRLPPIVTRLPLPIIPECERGESERGRAVSHKGDTEWRIDSAGPEKKNEPSVYTLLTQHHSLGNIFCPKKFLVEKKALLPFINFPIK